MRVGALLSSRRGSTIEETEPVREAAARMQTRHQRALVVTRRGRAIGIVTRRDIFERVISGQLPQRTPISQIMSSGLVCASSELSVEDAIALMVKHRIRYLPIICGDAAIGVIGLEVLAGWLLADRDAKINDPIYLITH